MKRRSFLRYSLELIVLIGFLVLGVTVLTYLFYKIEFDHTIIGSIVLATGVLQLTDFFTWKFARRIRSIQTMIAALASIALGLIFIFVNMDPKVLYILWGSFSIAFALAKIATGATNVSYQPLISTVNIFIAIAEIVFSILLIVRTDRFISSFVMFLAITLIIEAVTLFIEFMIHRYQQI